MTQQPLSWFGIFRLGLVQTSLGAIVVLTTSTMNRVMVVEHMLPAMLPGVLVALHYAVQILRPRMGHGSDVGGRRTPWIIGGMGVLALGGVAAAAGTAWMGSNPIGGIALAVVAFAAIGAGVGASGTSLLVLLAKRVDDARKAPAATVVWVMMIAGFALTAGLAGHWLDPFTPARLIAVTAVVSGVAVLVTIFAVWNVEGDRVLAPTRARSLDAPPHPSFRDAMRQVWSEPTARRFSIFVFVSMLAYSGQDLILEPFAGLVFGYSPGESTTLAGVQHGGVLVGMIAVALACSPLGRNRFGTMTSWMIGGCIASGLALFGLAASGFVGPAWPLRTSVFILGVANGAFAVAAIGSMMALVNAGRGNREGVRMGLWGAAQAIAFGLGGFLGAAAIDLTRYLLGSPVTAYAIVFSSEAMLFVVAAKLAANISTRSPTAASRRSAISSDPYAVNLSRN